MFRDRSASSTPGRWWPDGTLIGDGPIDEVAVHGAWPAVLALHGFGATPNEVLMLTELAGELGLCRRAPMLPGHGTHASDLAKSGYADWYGVAEREFLQLAVRGPVIVAGQSMGSVLAMDLASKHPKLIAALVVLANATRMTSPYPDLAMAAVGQLGLTNFFMPKFGGPNILDVANKGSHRTYGTQPIRPALELRDAGLMVLRRLPRISCPTFIAHGKHDSVCPVENAWDVAGRLGTTDVELLVLDNSAHVITKDADRGLLRDRLRKFLLRVVRQQNQNGAGGAQVRPVDP
jgi:carboxylesterase